MTAISTSLFDGVAPAAPSSPDRTAGSRAGDSFRAELDRAMRRDDDPAGRQARSDRDSHGVDRPARPERPAPRDRADAADRSSRDDATRADRRDRSDRADRADRTDRADEARAEDEAIADEVAVEAPDRDTLDTTEDPRDTEPVVTAAGTPLEAPVATAETPVVTAPLLEALAEPTATDGTAPAAAATTAVVAADEGSTTGVVAHATTADPADTAAVDGAADLAAGVGGQAPKEDAATAPVVANATGGATTPTADGARTPVPAPTDPAAVGDVDAPSTTAAVPAGATTAPETAAGDTTASARPVDAATGAPATPSTGAERLQAPAPPTAPAAEARRATEPAPTVDLQRAVEISELGDRLGAALRRNTRFQSLSVQLHPAELGAVKVEARLVDGVTHIVFSPESGVGGERLAATLHELRQQMTRAGVQVGDLDVRQGNQGGSGNDQGGRPDETADLRRPSRASLATGRAAVPTAAASTPTTTTGAHVALDL